MPYTIQARMSQFGECTVYDPHTTSTFQEALLYIKEQMLAIKGRMWDYVLPNYTHFFYGLPSTTRPIDEVTSIPEQDGIYLMFGSSHSNCECWGFEVTRSE